MDDLQIFAGPLGVDEIVIPVLRFSRAPRIGAPRLRDLGLQMRIEHRQLRVEIGLDLGERDLALRLHLKMQRFALRFLLLKLRLMRGARGIDLRPPAPPTVSGPAVAKAARATDRTTIRFAD